MFLIYKCIIHYDKCFRRIPANNLSQLLTVIINIDESSPDSGFTVCWKNTLMAQTRLRITSPVKDQQPSCHVQDQCTYMNVVKNKYKLFKRKLAIFQHLSHLKAASNESDDLSRDMRFPTMWFMRPAKPQISLRLRAV